MRDFFIVDEIEMVHLEVRFMVNAGRLVALVVLADKKFTKIFDRLFLF